MFANVTESKSTVYALPLPLENNSTIAGTGGILNEFGRMFSIQPNQTKDYLSYDEVTKTFSLKHARHHLEFLRIMHDHQDEMAEYEKQICDTEKLIDNLEYVCVCRLSCIHIVSEFIMS